MKKITSLLLGALCLAGAVYSEARAAEPRVKVACVGNSITYGFLSGDPAVDSYPAQLRAMVDTTRYDVRNFGKSRSTLLEKGHFPYVDQPEYEAALAFAPDVVVIHLGVNDTDPRNWPDYNNEFVGDYLRLIDSFRKANPGVRIILANLTPLSAKHPRFKSGTCVWRDQVRDRVRDVAAIAGTDYIDYQDALIDRPDLLPDGIHPNRQGSGLLAKAAYGAITGDYGGLKMGPLYTDGMVLQRRRKLNIAGTADTGSTVTVELLGQKAQAKAGVDGRWNVEIGPFEATADATLTIDDGKTRLSYGNVAVGEVWIASGQSNMAFMVVQERGGKDRIAASDDPGLRFFNMQPRYFTNNVTWSPGALDTINNLGHYVPTVWVEASPKTTPRMSAVAYEFARMLRDSLPDVPVGIINNAVGGATTESFVEMNTLMHGLPEDLLNWRKNDYLQPWAQGRADLNAPATRENPGQRHPYEPTYLYASGVRPLEGYDLAGMLWYQGESNAHNIEVHEALFPLVVKSYREGFRNLDLPVLMVQLSSIARPSWPQFRDSQRRMASAMPGVEMAVSFDHGDSLDVHPTNKRPVGERLGRIALAKLYGHNSLEYSGPQPESATAVGDDGRVALLMSHAAGMTTTDGQAPATFELAEYEGYYFPAEASIEGNMVMLSSPQVKNPRFVRYAWIPFARKANLTNSSKIPTSTFKMAVESGAQTRAVISQAPEISGAEKGLEKGVSAVYGAVIDGGTTPIVAGGCNFPEKDPLAPKAAKKFYKGVYALENGRWVKILDLPKAAAYGASFVSGDEVVFAGGTIDGKPSAEALRLRFAREGAVRRAGFAAAAPLPALIDNAGFCSADGKGYLVGGALDGVPSNRVFVYDFATDSYSELPAMPGNPRVQPVAAVSGGCLYVWGGFAGKGEGREATLNTDGLMFDFATLTWTELPAPVADGTELSLGGGTAATLADGRILAVGGVNKDVFLEALRNQAPDYLMHDPGWYRFNPYVMVFDPATGVWSVAGKSDECARAGALLLPCADGSNYLYGGELKPRIRTPRIADIVIE